MSKTTDERLEEILKFFDRTSVLHVRELRGIIGSIRVEADAEKETCYRNILQKLASLEELAVFYRGVISTDGRRIEHWRKRHDRLRDTLKIYRHSPGENGPAISALEFDAEQDKK